MELSDYLAAAARRPWEWGEHDCCTFMAGWVISRGHSDPMAFMRGRYDSERSALRRIVSNGGLVELAKTGMASIPKVGIPQAGDVGVIERPTADGLNQACAIYGGERWVTLAAGGIDSAPAVPLAVWRP